MTPPGLTRLYSDYLCDFDRLAAFYPGGRPFDLAALRAAAARAAARWDDAARGRLAETLLRQNRGWGAPEPVLAAIEQLRRPGAVVIVAGQQAALFGGPLLCLLKALTALRWAEQLRAAGVDAAAVFWIASQDHDLAEINQAHVAADGEVRTLRLAVAAVPQQPVGLYRLGAEVEVELRQLAELVPAATSALTRLRLAYAPGVSFADAFARLYADWLGPLGLILFDPMNAADLAPTLRPLYTAALADAEIWEAALLRRNGELTAAGYHAQVTSAAHVVPLFFHRDGARQPLRRDLKTGGFECGGEPLTREAALAFVRDHPGDVSPAALLRPLAQDRLFPVAAQVAGPAEIAYLAQSSAIRDAAGEPHPVIAPRVSATLLDARCRRLLDKLEVTVEECWTADLALLAARRRLPAGVVDRLASLGAELDAGFQSLREQLGALDPTLLDPAATALQKIHHQLEQLDGRIARAWSRRNEEIVRHANWLAAHLFPRRQLQERLLNAATLADDAATQKLHSQLDVTTPGHQLLEI